MLFLFFKIPQPSLGAKVVNKVMPQTETFLMVVMWRVEVQIGVGEVGS